MQVMGYNCGIILLLHFSGKVNFVAKILLLMSQYTGRGHMSIAEALSEQFQRMEDIVLDVVDGFQFMGSQGIRSSKLYNIITRKASFVWKTAFSATQNNDFIPETMGKLVEKRLANYVRNTKPDLILTVHSMFVGSVLDALERAKLDIPVVCLQADIVNIHSTWCDKRLLKCICPTEEAYARSLEFGMPEDKLEVIGFPTRSQFTKSACAASGRTYDASRPLRCMMTGGGGGAGEIEDYATSLMEDTDASLTVICGSNEALKERLVGKFGIKYSDRMRILGFVSDMSSEYELSDVAIMRASPNCMFEAVVMGVPMIITGALPGQEADNPRFAVEHGLGITCYDHRELGARIKDLTANGGEMLKAMRESQLAYRDLDNARKIAEYVYNLINTDHDA